MVGVVQAADEGFGLVIERNNQRLHVAFDHAELVGNGLEGKIQALPGVAVHLQDLFVIQFFAF